MKTTTVFYIFIFVFCFQLQAQSNKAGILWSEGEHLELGQMGAYLACQNLSIRPQDCPILNIYRKDKKVKFKYGELLMLSDYYLTPEKLWNDKNKRLDRLIKCAYKQIAVHDDQESSESEKTPDIKGDGTKDKPLYFDENQNKLLNQNSNSETQSHSSEYTEKNNLLTKDPEYPDCNTVGFIAKPSYIEVITKNYDHFGWNSMKAYIKYHTQALMLARESYELDQQIAELQNQKGEFSHHKQSASAHSQKQLNDLKDFQELNALQTKTEDLFTLALINNAFADHFLTDSFASGHVRTPRIQIKRWADQNLNGVLKKTRGDLLSMMLHDAESRNLTNNMEMGLRVQNSFGDIWFTRADKKLHYKSFEGDPTIMQPLTAVSQSFQELLIAKTTGTLPEGTFNATFYVPFTTDIPLKQKLTPEFHKMKQKDFLRSLLSSLPTFIKWIFPKSDLEKMLSDIDKIMGQFRLDIEQDLVSDPQINKRLPSAYLEEFKQVN